MIIDEETYLEHYGVKGMKWGVKKAALRSAQASLNSKPAKAGQAVGKKIAERRGDRPDTPASARPKLSADRATTATTRRVINDYNNMSDRQFAGKYQVSKERYAKRVEKHGDPYARRTKKNPRLAATEKQIQAQIKKDQKVAAYRKNHPEPAKDHRKAKIALGVAGAAYVATALAIYSTPQGRQIMNQGLETVKHVGEAAVARRQMSKSDIFNPYRYAGEAVDAVVKGAGDGVA